MCWGDSSRRDNCWFGMRDLDLEQWPGNPRLSTVELYYRISQIYYFLSYIFFSFPHSVFVCSFKLLLEITCIGCWARWLPRDPPPCPCYCLLRWRAVHQNLGPGPSRDCSLRPGLPSSDSEVFEMCFQNAQEPCSWVCGWGQCSETWLGQVLRIIYHCAESAGWSFK